MTPVERSVLDGARTHPDVDGFEVANDEDVARIAMTVAEHRSFLMDRLAR
jgi:hypothetical protein